MTMVEVSANRHAATQGGCDTGISVKKDDVLAITVAAGQTWTVSNKETSASGFTTPGAFEDGIEAYDYYIKKEDDGESPAFITGSLVGSLDGGNTFFPVGTKITMTTLRPGTLELYCWTDYPEGSRGSVQVDVRVHPIREELADKNGARRIRVYAYNHSTEMGIGKHTGISVKPGDILKIGVDYNDTWEEGKDHRYTETANGDIDIDRPIAVGAGGKFKFRRTALIGSLNSGKYYFPVGTHLEMTALCEGSLTLFCASDTPDNNQLWVDAYVRTETPADLQLPAKVEIGYVDRGASLQEEYIQIINKGGQPVNIAGWFLTGTSDEWQFEGRYRLPNIELDADENVKIYTNNPNADANRGEYDMGRPNSLYQGANIEVNLYDDTRKSVYTLTV